MREGIMTRVSHRASEALLSNESASDSRDGVSLPGVFNDPDPARGHEPDPTSIAFRPLSETSIHMAFACAESPNPRSACSELVEI